MIRRVLLENWKSHAKSEFEFEKGTNVLVGVSGSGKTSVMDAICFALYGTFPQAAAREIKLEEVIRQQPTKSDFCKVTVEFEYGKKNFELTRTIFRNSSNQAVLKENGSLMAGPKPAEVSKRVEEIIEVNYDLFTRAIYSEQNQIDYFLKLNPAQRKEKIDDLLLLNKYELVRANAVNMQNRLKKQLEDKTMWLEELKEGFDEKALEEVLKKILEKQTAAEFSKKEKIFLEAELKKVLEQISELEKKMKEFLFYKELLIKVGAGAAELQKTILYTKKKMDKKSLTELLETEKNLLEKIMEKKKQAKELEKEQKETQNKTSELLEKKGALEEKVAQKIKQAKELKSSKGVCPVCNRKLEEHLKGELISETALKVEKTGLEIKQIKERMDQEEKKAEKNFFTLEKIQKEILAAHDEVLGTKDLIKSAKELLEKEAEHKNLLEEQKKISEQVEKLGFLEKETRDARNSQTSLREKIYGLEMEMKISGELIEQLKENEKRLIAAKNSIKEIEETAKRLSKTIEQVTIFVNVLKETQALLRYSLINTVNEAMNDIWQNIYPYGDFESAKIEINETGNYEIMVKQKNGEWERAEGILSGGERSCVALTLRIAISLVLAQNLSWIILDEPTHNLDANTIARLSHMMKNHLPGLVDQIFIITHDKEMELAANGSLYFLEREKDSQGPTRPLLQEIR